MTQNVFTTLLEILQNKPESVEAVDPIKGGKYRGYVIQPNTKRIDKRNPVSGHEWTEHEPSSGFTIYGPFMFPNTTRKSVKTAMEYIDFFIKFNLHKESPSVQ